MKRTGCLLLVLLLGLANARAEEPVKLSASAMFREAYRIQTRADEARDLYRNADALALYRAARDAFRRLVEEYPDWLPGDTRYRVSYCDEKLRAMQTRSGVANTSVLPLTADETVPRGQVTPAVAPTPGPPTAPAATAPAGNSGIEGTLTSVRYYLSEGEHEQARAALLTAMRKEPDNRNVRLLMSLAQCQAGRYRDSVHVAKQLIDEDAADPHAHMVLASGYFGLGYLAESAAELRKTVELDPRTPHPHYNLAQILLLMAPVDRNAAGYHYREALKRGAMRDPAVEMALDTGRFPAPADTRTSDEVPPTPRAEPPTPGAADGSSPWYKRIWTPWGGEAE